MPITKLKLPTRKVWRISADKPMGEWVDSMPAPEPAPAPGVPRGLRDAQGDGDGHWLMSSFDLLSGSDVSEEEDTIPGELFDELFAPKRDAPKDTHK